MPLGGLCASRVTFGRSVRRRRKDSVLACPSIQGSGRTEPTDRRCRPPHPVQATGPTAWMHTEESSVLGSWRQPRATRQAERANQPRAEWSSGEASGMHEEWWARPGPFGRWG
jgi:hypothetical protein